ncbi:MAG: DNA mismatch endonuclease Vsr [Enhydrobacter sp.]|nr:DNA mismatch endonuclease Vsr [Enhydrobacter sp.]
MRRVRQRGTSPELVVAKIARGVGLHYRLNVKSLPGSPDLANKRNQWAIFANGCFWHHHTGCSLATTPRRNANFWKAKFVANRARDTRKIKQLRSLGFRVIVVWQCQTANHKALALRLSKLRKPRPVKAA